MNRTCLSLAVAAALGAASGALANPIGPEVVQGAATINASGRTLTVVPTSGAIIDWRGFVIAPDETTRFVQPSPSATVLNRIGSTAFGLFGRLESNGRLLFMQSGRVFGDGIALDLPAINVAALRQPLLVRATTRDVDFRSVRSTGRTVDPWVVMILPEAVPVSAAGGVLLPSGVSAELADARWPHVRVLITAPPGQPLDVAQLLRKSGALGIFGSLLAVPRGQSAEGADQPLQLASAEETPLAVAPPALPDAAPAADQPIQAALQVALRNEMPLPAPKPLTSGDDEIVASVVAPAEVRPPASVPLAMGEDDIVAPVVASAQVRPAASVLLALGDDDIAAPVAGLAEAGPAASIRLASGDDDFVAPVIAMAQVQPRPSVPLAAGDDDIVAPILALAEAPTTTTVEPVILAAVQTGTMHDAAVAEQPVALLDPRPVTIAAMQAAPVLRVEAPEAPAGPALRELVAAAPQAVPQPAAPSVLAEPAAASAERAAPVIVASAETSYRRVALVASDTPVWPAPVKLERVERRMPVIMFDRKGGIFHL